MSLRLEGFTRKLEERIRSGIIFMGGAYATEWLSERFARKYAKEYSEIAVGLGTALGLDILGIKEKLGSYEPYINDLADAMSDFGFLKIMDYKIVKKPFCYFKDTNTIRCINFDVDTLSDGTTIYVSVYVDDTAIDVSGVTGSPSDFEIALATPVAEGWHKLVVEAGNTKKDAFSTKKSYART